MTIEDGGRAVQRFVGRQVHIQAEQVLLLYNILHPCSSLALSHPCPPAGLIMGSGSSFRQARCVTCIQSLCITATAM